MNYFIHSSDTDYKNLISYPDNGQDFRLRLLSILKTDFGQLLRGQFHIHSLLSRITRQLSVIDYKCTNPLLSIWFFSCSSRISPFAEKVNCIFTVHSPPFPHSQSLCYALNCLLTQTGLLMNGRSLHRSGHLAHLCKHNHKMA